MKEEIWKPIKGFEDLYEISNTGRIRALERITLDGRKLLPYEKKVSLNGKHKVVQLIDKDFNRKIFYINRLLYENFGIADKSL